MFPEEVAWIVKVGKSKSAAHALTHIAASVWKKKEIQTGNSKLLLVE